MRHDPPDETVIAPDPAAVLGRTRGAATARGAIFSTGVARTAGIDGTRGRAGADAAPAVEGGT